MQDQADIALFSACFSAIECLARPQAALQPFAQNDIVDAFGRRGVLEFAAIDIGK